MSIPYGWSEIDLGLTDGEEITAMVPLGKSLFVFTDRRTLKLTKKSAMRMWVERVFRKLRTRWLP